MKRLICIIITVLISCSLIIQAKADTDIYAGVIVDDGYKEITFYVREKIDYSRSISSNTDINQMIPASSKKAYSPISMVNIKKSYSAKRLVNSWYDENGEYNEGEIGEGSLLPGVSIELKINDEIGYQLLGVTDAEGKIETYLSARTYQFRAYKAGYKTAYGEVEVLPDVQAINMHLVMEKEESSTGEPTIEESSDDTKPSDTEPSDTKPSDTEPDDTKPSDTEPDDTKPSDTEPDDTKPSDTKPDDTKPSDTEPDDTKPSDTEPDGTKPSDTEPDDTKPTEPVLGPNTGDNTPADVFIYILIAALAIIIFVVMKQDKEQKQQNK